MRDPNEIIFKIDDISKLNIIEQKHKIKCVGKEELDLFNKHLKLCKPWHQRLFFKGITKTEWENLFLEETEYYLLFDNNNPVARCAIERYSDTAWEAADVKTVPKYRNMGISKELVYFVTRRILEQEKTATCSTLPNNHAMLAVIKALGYKNSNIEISVVSDAKRP